MTLRSCAILLAKASIFPAVAWYFLFHLLVVFSLAERKNDQQKEDKSTAMRLTFLSTSSLDDPSPRGRWLPLAQELAARGHIVRLIMLHPTYDRLPASARWQQRGGVMVYYAGQMHVYGPVDRRRYYGSAALLRVTLLATLNLLRAALEFKADALHICKPQPMNGLAGLLAARRLGCPLYVDCDDYEAGGNRFGAGWQQRLVRFWEDQLPQRAAAVTVNTRFLQRRYADLGIAPARLTYVPNGITRAQLAAPDPRHVAGLRAALGLRDAPLVVYAGTLSQTSHNVGLLLDAFALLARHMPSARLLLVGAGADRVVLQNQARSLGLGERAIFAGYVSPAAVPAYLALADCSVDPVADNAVAAARSPLKIVESMACGVPVVTGAVGDRREMLGHDGGVLVQPGDAQALADGLAALLESNGQRARRAELTRQQAATYRWDRLATEWMQVYG
jgi:glycosyltransferase involved in cell wall biosynthesis